MTNTNQAAEFFVSQWGYEQTNVTFYKVLKRTAKMIVMIEVKNKIERIDWGNYLAMPTDEPTEWAEPLRRKIDVDRRVVEVARIKSYAYAHKWDGEAVKGTDYY